MKMDEHVPTMAGLFDMLNPGRKWARAISLLAVEAVVLSGPRKGGPLSIGLIEGKFVGKR